MNQDINKWRVTIVKLARTQLESLDCIRVVWFDRAPPNLIEKMCPSDSKSSTCITPPRTLTTPILMIVPARTSHYNRIGQIKLRNSSNTIWRQLWSIMCRGRTLGRACTWVTFQVTDPFNLTTWTAHTMRNLTSQRASHTPVSYTHLTLPTICSV